jgi:hypothetical protein
MVYFSTETDQHLDGKTGKQGLTLDKRWGGSLLILHKKKLV